MNDLEEGNFLYHPLCYDGKICISKCTFVKYTGNKIIAKFIEYDFSCQYTKTELFKSPVEAFEFALKKYADIW